MKARVNFIFVLFWELNKFIEMNWLGYVSLPLCFVKTNSGWFWTFMLLPRWYKVGVKFTANNSVKNICVRIIRNERTKSLRDLPGEIHGWKICPMYSNFVELFQKVTVRQNFLQLFQCRIDGSFVSPFLKKFVLNEA